MMMILIRLCVSPPLLVLSYRYGYTTTFFCFSICSQTDTHGETNVSYDKMESIILKEIRESLEREADWANSHQGASLSPKTEEEGGHLRSNGEADYQRVSMPSVRYSFHVDSLDRETVVPEQHEAIRIVRIII